MINTCVCCGSQIEEDDRMVCRDCERKHNNPRCPYCGDVLVSFYEELNANTELLSLWHCKTCLTDWQSKWSSHGDIKLERKFWG
jgi:hypothetical protein